MSAAERDALDLSDLADATDAAAQADADAAVAAAEAAKLARLEPVIRVLETVNAPISSASDAFRDALGKIAILTLVNSIAVLIYVLFIRR